jgi:hypothetical protein
MPPKKRQHVLDAWCSGDGGSAARSGDDRAPEPAAMPAVSLVSAIAGNPVASPCVMPSPDPMKQQL